MYKVLYIFPASDQYCTCTLYMHADVNNYTLYTATCKQVYMHNCTSIEAAEWKALIHLLYSSSFSAANCNIPSLRGCFTLSAHCLFTSLSAVTLLRGRNSLRLGPCVLPDLWHSRKLLRIRQYILFHVNRSFL